MKSEDALRAVCETGEFRVALSARECVSLPDHRRQSCNRATPRAEYSVAKKGLFEDTSRGGNAESRLSRFHWIRDTIESRKNKENSHGNVANP